MIHIAADHAGYKLKQKIKEYLFEKGYPIVDWGAHKLDKNDDYPDYAKKVGKAVQKNGKGILICGSAEGMCIAANKILGIRAIAAWDVKNAKLSREHNDANVLCLSGRQLTQKKAEQIVMTWLKTEFSKDKRHVRRIEKIKKMEHK